MKICVEYTGNVDRLLLNVYNLDRMLLGRFIFDFPISLQRMAKRWNDHHSDKYYRRVASLGLWEVLVSLAHTVATYLCNRSWKVRCLLLTESRRCYACSMKGQKMIEDILMCFIKTEIQVVVSKLLLEMICSLDSKDPHPWISGLSLSSLPHCRLWRRNIPSVLCSLPRWPGTNLVSPTLSNQKEAQKDGLLDVFLVVWNADFWDDPTKMKELHGTSILEHQFVLQKEKHMKEALAMREWEINESSFWCFHWIHSDVPGSW